MCCKILCKAYGAKVTILTYTELWKANHKTAVGFLFGLLYVQAFTCAMLTFAKLKLALPHVAFLDTLPSNRVRVKESVSRVHGTPSI